MKRLNSITAELSALKDKVETVGKSDSVGDNGEGEVRDTLESRNFAIMKTVIDVAHHNCTRPHEKFISLESLYRMFGKPQLTAKDNLLMSTVDELARSSFQYRELQRKYIKLREELNPSPSGDGSW